VIFPDELSYFFPFLDWTKNQVNKKSLSREQLCTIWRRAEKLTGLAGASESLLARAKEKHGRFQANYSRVLFESTLT
jgi:hypothetical protein